MERISEGRAGYVWTPARVVVATLMVTALLAFTGLMVVRTFGEDLSKPPPRQVEPQFDVTGLTVDGDEIVLGGPPKDGIPALTDPSVVSVAEADYLHHLDRIVEVSIGEVVRGYPLRILIWHEVVNDVVDGVPIAVVYCPLCDSVSVVDRRLDDRTLSFGVSGLLLNSNVLMFERTTDALWSQLALEAISGPDAGRALEHLPWALTTWGVFRAERPEATVLSADTGFRGPYEDMPYTDYFESPDLRFGVSRMDPRLPPKERVVGVWHEGLSRVYPVAAVREAPGRVLRDEIAGQPLVLEAGERAGTVRVVEVPRGARVVHTYWFAWAAFHAETEIYSQDD
jgi:hypothetical protein